TDATPPEPNHTSYPSAKNHPSTRKIVTAPKRGTRPQLQRVWRVNTNGVCQPGHIVILGHMTFQALLRMVGFQEQNM
ncbi:hypothetical protein NPIL_302001, partial [Nephila pilipes]